MVFKLIYKNVSSYSMITQFQTLINNDIHTHTTINLTTYLFIYFRTMTESVVDLVGHQRRVGLVLWHPSAQNILLSAGSDNKVCLWNVGTGECLLNFMLPGQYFQYLDIRLNITDQLA